MNNIEIYNETIFENIKHEDEFGEFWYARELCKILEYGEFRKFLPVIKKAMVSCENSNQPIEDHFAEVDVMVKIGPNAKRKRLRYREDILDNMGSDELIINLFRISQTEQKLKKDNIKGEKNANKTHYKVGSKIRETIKKLGGTMPNKSANALIK